MKSFKLLLTIAGFCCYTSAIAATYYVDAQNGKDTWSGTSSSVSSTNGPWQSISKVNTAALQPGDQVLFTCGQTWYETLKPSSNGTASAKIYFGTYPTQCTNKPKISGFESIPNYSWQLHQGNIWKTTFPLNLLINSSFSQSLGNWKKWPSDASQAFSSSCPLSVTNCMNFLAGPSTINSLALSSQFPVIGGGKYTATISFYAPTGTSIVLIARENGNSYRNVGLHKDKITGNGSWQDVTVEFTANRTIPNARLDIEVPKNQRIYIKYAQVKKKEAQLKPSIVIVDGDPITVAHHPNKGYDTDRPESNFLITTGPSPSFKDSAGRLVSSQIQVGDLKLPPGGNISTSTKLMLRNFDYRINEFTVTNINTNSISFSPNTAYPIKDGGWGYYFYDALWMLDSAGEWFFDTTTQTLYVQAPNNGNPGTSVRVTALNKAIDLSAKSNLTIENLEIDGAATGIDISNSSNILLRYLNIHNIKNHGVIANSNAVDPTIASNRITRAGIAGIETFNSINAQILNNEISEIGVVYKAGKQISLPAPTTAAIWGGYGADIYNNLLTDIGTYGILALKDNLIDSNVIKRSCTTLNDCAAIYAYSLSPNTIIKNNMIIGVPGNIDGIPPTNAEHLIGIYLDQAVPNITITGNTVIGATHSIQLHDSNKCSIDRNIIYGSKRKLLWMNEDTKDVRTAGDLYGNTVSNNQFFSTAEGASINNTSIIGDTFDFANYSGNYYSSIQWKTIASEASPNFFREYTFPEWQKAITTTGSLRNNDIKGSNPAPLPSFAQGIVGSDFMNNGKFTNGLVNWGTYNSTSPSASRSLEGCLPTSTNCLRVNAGGSQTLTYSPKFALTKDKFYRVSFDMKASLNNIHLISIVRFAGPNNFNHLISTTPYFSTSTNWTRYSFIFKATDTAANPTLNNQGARLDLDGLPSGQSLWIANLEIASFDQGGTGQARSDILVNSLESYTNIDCPTRKTNAALCSSYVTFPEGKVATWPISVPPRSGKIVFTQNLSLLDTDGDGIADSQDQCKTTLKGLTVNTKGCSLSD